METDRHRTTTAGAPRVLRSVRYAHADRTPHDPEVQALRRELWEVRRRMTADVAEERVLLQKLRDRGVEEGRDADRDFVTGARIQQLEAELRDAQAGAKYERSKRHRLEAVVEDIRRECKEPFVVPALLEAFLTISNLTTEAMQED
ncbi:hypothetical protein DFH07DRAFT_272579 [Mycena maculata]|uniref:Uncharacterized protein n=1 Tax=Mycena maculata TaxID=230809 RepID=A0AAD7NQ44_9AGAR|nr:hypothetical protein DFH07DRAFT_272579 [Mycena maculata]